MNKFIDFLGKIRINHHQVIQLSSDYSRQKILAKEKTNAVVINTHTIADSTLTSGPESYTNIKKSLSEIDLQRLVESSPVLKATN